MKSRRSVDTELLYRGNHIPGIAELPDTPPIYPGQPRRKIFL